MTQPHAGPSADARTTHAAVIEGFQPVERLEPDMVSEQQGNDYSLVLSMVPDPEGRYVQYIDWGLADQYGRSKREEVVRLQDALAASERALRAAEEERDDLAKKFSDMMTFAARQEMLVAQLRAEREDMERQRNGVVAEWQREREVDRLTRERDAHGEAGKDTARLEAIPNLRAGFMTSHSIGAEGRYWIELEFPSLAVLQAACDEMHALRTQPTERTCKDAQRLNWLAGQENVCLGLVTMATDRKCPSTGEHYETDVAALVIRDRDDNVIGEELRANTLRGVIDRAISTYAPAPAIDMDAFDGLAATPTPEADHA